MAIHLTIESKPEKRNERIPVSISRLSRETGYSKSHISRVFNRKRTPSVECLAEISVLVGLNMTEMMDGIRDRKFKTVWTDKEEQNE